MLPNKEKVIQAVESCGEIGVAGLSERLRLDKGTCRKVALEAAREGRIGVRNNGQGYVFYSAGDPQSKPREHHPYRPPEFLRSTGNSQIVNLSRDDFEVTDSRLWNQQHGLPAIRHDASRGPYGGAIWQNMPDVASLFDTDPDGSQTSGTLQQQALGQLYGAVVQLGGEVRQLRAELKQERQTATAMQETARKRDWDDALAGIMQWGAAPSTPSPALPAPTPEERRPSFAEAVREAREERRAAIAEEAERTYNEVVKRTVNKLIDDGWDEDEAWAYADTAGTAHPARKPEKRSVIEILDRRPRPRPQPSQDRWRQAGLLGAVAGAAVLLVGIFNRRLGEGFDFCIFIMLERDVMREEYLRSRTFQMVLTPNEASRLKRQAHKLGTTQAGVFRQALQSDVFDDVDVRPGRKEGISPQRRLNQD